MASKLISAPAAFASQDAEASAPPPFQAIQPGGDMTTEKIRECEKRVAFAKTRQGTHEDVTTNELVNNQATYVDMLVERANLNNPGPGLVGLGQQNQQILGFLGQLTADVLQLRVEVCSSLHPPRDFFDVKTADLDCKQGPQCAGAKR